VFGDPVAAALEAVEARSGRAVIAVDGYSAAGKSTFADALADVMPAVVVRGDDFYRVMDEDDRARLSPPEGIARYDWERLRDEVLSPVVEGRPATYRPYDWDMGQLAGRTITVPAASTVVVEGLFVSRHELERYFDLSVLVEAPPETRRRRQLERADASEWLRRWDAAERLFFERVRPPETFDVVVDGTTPPARGL
jgi:uridine kinase